MKLIAGIAVIALIVIAACSTAGPEAKTSASPARDRSQAGAATPAALAVAPPVGAQRLEGGCGVTDIFTGGTLPDWAELNAPRSLPYVVAKPGLAVGYLFTHPMKAGLDAQTKILWYVATPRGGYPLNAEGHPIGSSGPTVTFSRAADSSPGEIYPTNPTVPAGGCWQFNLTWGGGDQHAEIDILFS